MSNICNVFHMAPINLTVKHAIIIISLYPKTEGFITSIQDKVIRTRKYERHVLKNDIVDKCRKCGAVGETIEHGHSRMPYSI